MSISNNERALRANSALSAYSNDYDQDADMHGDLNDSSLIALLLADMRHLCDAQGWRWSDLADDSRLIYERDTTGMIKADCDFANI